MTSALQEIERSLPFASCDILPTDHLSGFHSLSKSKANRDLKCLGHAFRKSTAGAFGPDLAKKLAQLVKMEKNVMRSMEMVGRERMEVAVNLAHKIRAIEQN